MHRLYALGRTEDVGVCRRAWRRVMRSVICRPYLKAMVSTLERHVTVVTVSVASLVLTKVSPMASPVLSDWSPAVSVGSSVVSVGSMVSLNCSRVSSVCTWAVEDKARSVMARKGRYPLCMVVGLRLLLYIKESRACAHSSCKVITTLSIIRAMSCLL